MSRAILIRRWVGICGAKGRWTRHDAPSSMPGHRNGAHRHEKRCSTCAEESAHLTAAGQALEGGTTWEAKLATTEAYPRLYELDGGGAG